MKKINITLTDADEAAIEKIKEEFGIVSRSAAIRFAVHAMVGGRGVHSRIDSHIDSNAPKKDKNKAPAD